MRQFIRVLALTVLALGVSSCAHMAPRVEPGVVTQVSTITALLDGGYDGVIPCGELRQKGDFGIGTFDHLDGEMVLIDGVIFQAKADGSVNLVPDSQTVPFAAVTQFPVSSSRKVGAASDLEALKKALDVFRPGNNLFYAFRLDGVFDYVKFRSVPAQVKPYPKLVDVAARQPVFERRSIRGTLVGFWCPEYAKTLNLPGYHLHFISEDRKSAGHLLNCAWQGGEVKMGTLNEFHLILPTTQEFQSLHLSGDTAGAMKAAESGK